MENDYYLNLTGKLLAVASYYRDKYWSTNNPEDYTRYIAYEAKVRDLQAARKARTQKIYL